MALNFPNVSRSYDPRWDRVRFWGYDGALEVGFLVEASALLKLVPGMSAAETGILAAFDEVRDRILEAANLRYSAWERRSFYVLAAEDFQ
jgi:hypothetical protein